MLSRHSKQSFAFLVQVSRAPIFYPISLGIRNNHPDGNASLLIALPTLPIHFEQHQLYHVQCGNAEPKNKTTHFSRLFSLLNIKKHFGNFSYIAFEELVA